MGGGKKTTNGTLKEKSVLRTGQGGEGGGVEGEGSKLLRAALFIQESQVSASVKHTTASMTASDR